MAIRLTSQVSHHSLCSLDICDVLSLYFTVRVSTYSREFLWLLPSKVQIEVCCVEHKISELRLNRHHQVNAERNEHDSEWIQLFQGVHFNDSLIIAVENNSLLELNSFHPSTPSWTTKRFFTITESNSFANDDTFTQMWREVTRIACNFLKMPQFRNWTLLTKIAKMMWGLKLEDESDEAENHFYAKPLFTFSWFLLDNPLHKYPLNIPAIYIHNGCGTVDAYYFSLPAISNFLQQSFEVQN